MPQEDLARFNYSEEDVMLNKYDPNFKALMEYETERANKYFELATHNLNLDDKSSMFAARAMQHIYKKLLDKIIEADYDIYQKNIRVSTFEKIGISVGVWAKYSLVY